MSAERIEFEVLMSAMHQDDFKIAHKTKVASDLLIINQCDRDQYDEMEVDGHTWRMISTTERGVSKSRNKAMDNARGKICMFSDDDEIFVDGYQDIIMKAYEELSDAAAIVFNVDRINYKMKKTYYRISQKRLAPWYRGYSTQMLTIRLDKINEHNIRNNEKFGSGSPWGGGEEILFEDAIRDAGLKFYEYPEVIAVVDYGEGSHWFYGYTKKYFYELGAFVYYKFGKNILLRELRCLFTCYRLRRERTLNWRQKMQWMHKGMKGFRQDITYEAYVKEKE